MKHVLLEQMLKDEKLNNMQLYSAGRYWQFKCRNIIDQILKNGLSDFRGYNSGVGTSYCDNVIINLWNEDPSKINKLLKWCVYNLPFIKRIGKLIEDTQCRFRSIHEEKLNLIQYILSSNREIGNLLSDFDMKDSSSFGCVDKVILGKTEVALHYLRQSFRIQFLSNKINFPSIFSLMEIGGGYGSHLHLMLKRYQNIRKVIYLDMVPNLYVGTEYLRSFFGNAVKDYLDTKNLDEIRFSNDTELEIICIAPWQIELINTQIDYFFNASSFVEMPEAVVYNYAIYINKLLGEKGIVSLISYKDFLEETTFNPDKLQDIFGKKLDKYEIPALLPCEPNVFSYIG